MLIFKMFIQAAGDGPAVRFLRGRSHSAVKQHISRYCNISVWMCSSACVLVLVLVRSKPGITPRLAAFRYFRTPQQKSESSAASEFGLNVSSASPLEEKIFVWMTSTTLPFCIGVCVRLLTSSTDTRSYWRSRCCCVHTETMPQPTPRHLNAASHTVVLTVMMDFYRRHSSFIGCTVRTVSTVACLSCDTTVCNSDFIGSSLLLWAAFTLWGCCFFICLFDANIWRFALLCRHPNTTGSEHHDRDWNLEAPQTWSSGARLWRTDVQALHVVVEDVAGEKALRRRRWNSCRFKDRCCHSGISK